MKRSNKKGFTLVELLVVIAIIAIIAAVAVPVTIGQINKAKISTAAQECGEVKNIVVQAVQDLAIKEELTASKLIDSIKESYTKFEQVTTIMVEKNIVTSGTPKNEVIVTVFSEVGADKADELNQIVLSDESKVVGVSSTLPGETIQIKYYNAGVKTNLSVNGTASRHAIIINIANGTDFSVGTTDPLKAVNPTRTYVPADTPAPTET